MMQYNNYLHHIYIALENKTSEAPDAKEYDCRELISKVIKRTNSKTIPTNGFDRKD
jgi:hypothetical protein